MIIAIDGPAGSGKSSTARAVADRLGILYIDTGAMYRAVGLACYRADPSLGHNACRDIVDTTEIDMEVDEDGLCVLLNGVDVSVEIRQPEAGTWASTVSAWPEVRDKLVAEQRRIAQASVDEGRGVVLDGRDIGTVVFPDAHLKIFMDADPRIRAQRRVDQLAEQDIEADIADVLNEILERDKRDRERKHAPLRQAADAVVLDTGDKTLEEQVDFVVELARERVR